jgi:hypothetical protein
MSALLESVGYSGWILHALIWLPVVGAGLVLWAEERRAKHVAFWWSVGVTVLSSRLWWAFDAAAPACRWRARAPGSRSGGSATRRHRRDQPAHGAADHVHHVDHGPRLVQLHPVKRERPFYALMLLLEAGVIGVFVATDVFLFYVFFELTLVPMYFIVGIWGGERRIYAAIKFFLYTAFGSLLMLVAILYLFFKGEVAAGWADVRVRRLAHGAAHVHRAALAVRRVRARVQRSRCRSSRCTPGCRTRTSRRPRPAR